MKFIFYPKLATCKPEHPVLQAEPQNNALILTSSSSLKTSIVTQIKGSVFFFRFVFEKSDTYVQVSHCTARRQDTGVEVGLKIIQGASGRLSIQDNVLARVE